MSRWTDAAGPLHLRAGEELERQFRELESRTRRRAFKRRGAFLGSVGAAVAALLLTPLGGTVAGAISSLAGVGEEPTAAVPDGERAVVVGVGEVSTAAIPYELIAETNGGELCFRIEFPVSEFDRGAGQCLTDQRAREVVSRTLEFAIAWAAPRGLYPDAQVIVQGLAPPSIRSIGVEYTDTDGVRHDVRTDVAPLDASLAQKLRIDDVLGFYFVGVPPGLLRADEEGKLTDELVREVMSSVTLTGYDAEGTPVRTDEPFSEGSFAASGATAGILAWPVPGFDSHEGRFPPGVGPPPELERLGAPAD